MKNLAMLSYQFLFDPSETWQHMSQFEQSFNAYLHEMGLEGQLIKPLGFGNAQRIIYIQPVKEVAPPKPTKPSTKPAGVQIRELGKQIK